MAVKFVYDFGEGNKEMKDLLGGKGANLAEMTRMGLPVPHGFTVTCEACNAYRSAGRRFPSGMLEEVAAHLEGLEGAMGRRLGDPADPLLVSVRSGARFSMPGMMDTVLNLGLNDQSVEGLGKQTGSARFAWDSYRRLLQMYGKTVMGVEGDRFEEALEQAKEAKGVGNDVELDEGDLRGLVAQYKAIISAETGREFPQAEYIIIKLKEAKESLKSLLFVPESKVCYQETEYHGHPICCNGSRTKQQPHGHMHCYGNQPR